MQNIILFLLEACINLFILRKILHTPITSSLLKRCSSLALVLIWSLSDMPIPYTFIIIPIALLLFHDKWYIILCSIIVCTLSLNIISNSILYLYCIITNNIHENRELMYTIDIFSLAFTLVGIYLVSKKIPTGSKPLNNINKQGYALIGLVTLVDFFLSSVSSLLFYYNLNTLGRHLLILAIFIMIAMSIALLLLYFRLGHYHSLLQQTNSINLKMLQLEERHYKELQEKNMDLRAFRHDYNYHVTAMQGLIQNEDLEGLKKYVKHLAEVKEQVYYFSTNHPVADSIVNYFYETVPENTIFQVDGKFSENIFLNDSDLCIVLSNLLKNAMEAVSKLDKTVEKQIYLSLYGNDNYIVLCIENSCKQPQNEELSSLTTSKSDTINHGFGLKNVREVIRKYSGKLDLKYNNHTFTASAYLRNVN